MRAPLLLIAVSLCLAHASPGRRRSNNNNNDVTNAERRQGPPGGFPDSHDPSLQREDDDGGRIGFYRGPPEGFPSFDHLFGAPGGSSQSQSSSRNPFGGLSAAPDSSREHYFQGQRGEEERPERYSEEEAYPGVPVLRPSSPGGSSYEEDYAPTGPSAPYRGSGEEPRESEGPFSSDEESFPPQHPPQANEEDSPPQRRPSYVPQAPHHSQEPIVLKVGSLQSPQGRMPPKGPSVFYAPSPDIQLSSGRHHRQKHRHTRSVNANATSPPANNATAEDDPMLADGSTQSKSTLYWPSSPFISFDHYKESSLEDDVSSSNARSDNANVPVNSSGFHDSTSEEQRFFPSFPSPYLSPFSSRPHSPLNFPGPSSNHRPSRYPSSSAPSSPPILPFSKFPSRGPSSAASHDNRYTDTNILGSGNFEVVRGGTYYGDEGSGGGSYGGGHHGGGGGGGGGGAYHSDSEDDYYSPPGNGHSSPYRGGSGGDFFANFRDFADINPHSRSFSHQSVQVLEEEEEPSASSHSSARRRPRPTFSMDYDPMVATF